MSVKDKIKTLIQDEELEIINEELFEASKAFSYRKQHKYYNGVPELCKAAGITRALYYSWNRGTALLFAYRALDIVSAVENKTGKKDTISKYRLCPWFEPKHPDVIVAYERIRARTLEDI